MKKEIKENGTENLIQNETDSNLSRRKFIIMLPIEFTLIYFGARPLIVQLKKRLAFKV